jgi:hypothetical protein
MILPILHKKETYVVLLHSCKNGIPDFWNRVCPINHVYLLDEDCSLLHFSIDKGMTGISMNWNRNFLYKEAKTLGDLSSGPPMSLVVRQATFKEKQNYIKNKGPVKTEYKTLFINSPDDAQK